MTRRSRLLRYALALGLVLLFAGYFAFSTFVFSPTESDYEPDVSTLVPRGVDFFVAKSDLRGDFERLPRLAVQDELGRTAAWRAWLESPERAELEARHKIEAGLAELERQLDAAGIDPLDVIGGDDLAVAGYFRGATLESADWAAYGRVNWMGKLAVAALDYPSLAGLDSRGITVAPGEGFVSVSGAGLPRPIHVARIQDVVVLGTSKELVEKAADLRARGGQESFGMSAAYNDEIAQSRRTSEGDDLELYVDWRTAMEKLQLAPRRPDANSDQPWEALLGRMFQLGSVRTLAGTIGFDRGVVVDLHGELSSETMSPFQKALYRQRGRESKAIVDALARIARPDTQVLAHLEVELGEFLTKLYSSLEPAQRQLIDEMLRSTGQYNGAAAAIKELDTLFKGRIGLIVRHNDFPVNAEKDPPHNDVPVPAFALVLWTEGSERTHKRLTELQKLVNDNQGRFGLQGRNGGRGVFINNLSGGFEAWEFWSPFIDGTGHIAVARNADLYFLSNSFQLVSDLLNRSNPLLDVERLSDRPDFNQLVNEAQPASNLFLWLNPQTLSKTLRAFAERSALDQAKARIDWDLERAREEDRVLREQFPGKRRNQLDSDTQRQLNEIVGPLLALRERELLREQVPALKASFDRQITYLEAISAALLTLSLDPKHFDLTLTAVTPLTPIPD
jgi:hypothetical protein